VTDHDHISDLRWDRLLAGDLPDDQRDAANAHAAGCARCRARRRELEAERDAFALRPLGVRFGARLARRRWWWGAPIAAIAAAAAVAIVISRKPSEGERTKGSDKPKLLLSAGHPGGLVPMATNDTIHPGDYLQAGYTTKRDGFGAVLSLDGGGHAMAYVPETGDTLIALPAGTERSFPGSTVLDDVVGKERIAIVWCDTPRPLGPLVAELRSTEQLAERDGCTIRLVVLDKVAAR